MAKSKERLKIVEKIKYYEKLGKFNEDVEDDAPAKTIRPSEMDYP